MVVGGMPQSVEAYCLGDDHRLEACEAAKREILSLYNADIGKYAKGDADQMPSLITHVRTSGELVIRCEKEDVAQLDGEALRAKEFRIRMVPGAQNLIVPEGMRFFEA